MNSPDDNPVAAPVFEIGGPAGSSWREQVLTRVAEQRTMLAWLTASQADPDAQTAALCAAVTKHLEAAEQAAAKAGTLRGALSGASVERTSGQLDAVECDLLRLANDDYRRGQLPSLLAHVRRHLEPDDPRRVAVEGLATRASDEPWHDWEHEQVLSAVHAASSKARREIRQIHSFRNTLYVTALLLTVAALAMAIVGWRSPSSIPLCFKPGAMVVCPTSDTPVKASTRGEAPNQAQLLEVMRNAPSPGDVALIELLGLMAAALAAAVALRSIRGTTTPYSLPIALAVLKLPTGALTAVIALVLIRGEFIPGLSALDSSAQILAWAVIFGYAQQVFTHLIDRQAHDVLDTVRSGGTASASRGPDGKPVTTPANA